MVYLGVDLHRKRSHVVALDEAGNVMLSRSVASRPEDFQRVFGELEPWSKSVVFEAAYGWSWFADLLADAGIEAHMAHPLATKAISAGRVKNDAVDARTLAHLLRTSLLRFVRLVSGELNAGLAYLSGKLDIEGEADLALAVGGIFRVPGSGSVAVDPRLLDPVDVATALGEVKGDHLRKVMRSGFRPVVLGEIFRRLPDFVSPERARGVRLCVGFRLTGNPDGEVERYVVEVVDGVATVTEGDPGGDRDATVSCEGHDFLRLVTGHLSPVVGVLKGQLKVKGDRTKALKLASVMDIPSAR